MANQVIDTDGHIFEKDEIILEFLEPPYKGRKDILTLPFFPSLDGFQRMARRVIDGRPYVKGVDDPRSWQEVLDREGIDRTVIFPTAGLAIGFIQDPDWAIAVSRAYNNMVSESYTKFDRRLGAVALLAIQDIQEAAKELRRAVTELHMYGGILAPVGFPKPLVEAGCEWIPFLMDRLDMEYKNRAHQAPLLKKKPSEYMKRGQIYYHTELWESMLPYAINRVGESQFLYASDYPHEPDLAEAVDEFQKRTDLTEEAKRKILSDNARRFYNMEN